MKIQIPASLGEAFAQWDAAGRPPASGSPWRRKKWEDAGVPVPASLPARAITREAVAAAAAAVSTDDRASQQAAFVIAMIWGFGGTRYGPFRVGRMMAEPDFADHLAEMTAAILEGGGVEAFRFVSRRRHSQGGFLKWIGPAFGTKYLYFVSLGSGARVGPILDDVVRQWFAIHVQEVNLRVDSWGHSARYEGYADVLSGWGEQLEITVGDVEYLIFAQQQSRNGNRAWSESWVGGPKVSAEQLLEQLRQALKGRGFAALAARPLEDIAQILERSGGAGDADG